MKKENFSNNLKEIREFLGIKQHELCKRCGFANSTISQFESGKRAPNLSSLVKLSNALRVSIDRLVFKND